MRLTSRWNQW